VIGILSPGGAELKPKNAKSASNKKGNLRKMSVKKQTIKDLSPTDAENVKGGPNHVLTGRC